MKADHRLASYGTLAPGEENHAQMDGMEGRWLKGVVRGRRFRQEVGKWIGYPAFVLDPSGDEITIHIFESADLPDYWPRLDAFEGEAYRRVVTKAETDEGEMDVSIYVSGP